MNNFPLTNIVLYSVIVSARIIREIKMIKFRIKSIETQS